jgi:hypothetical protein
MRVVATTLHLLHLLALLPNGALAQPARCDEAAITGRLRALDGACSAGAPAALPTSCSPECGAALVPLMSSCSAAVRAAVDALTLARLTSLSALCDTVPRAEVVDAIRECSATPPDLAPARTVPTGGHRRALQDDEALADDMTVPQLLGYLDDCLEGDAKAVVAPGPPPALPPPPLQRLPSSDDDSTPAGFAEAYRVTGCRDPLGCGTFTRTKASCDGSPGRRWQLSCDGPSSPTTCGRCAPVYLKDGAGEDGPVLFREVLTEGRSRWDIVQGVNGYNGRALDMCGGELLGSTNPVRVSRHTSQRSLHCIALVSFRAMMAVCLRCLAELWVAA